MPSAKGAGVPERYLNTAPLVHEPLPAPPCEAAHEYLDEGAAEPAMSVRARGCAADCWQGRRPCRAPRLCPRRRADDCNAGVLLWPLALAAAYAALALLTWWMWA